MPDRFAVAPSAEGRRPNAEGGYALLAAEVVAQALRDAPRKAHRADVLVSANSGTLGWWMAQAGVHERSIAPALEVIALIARASGRGARAPGGRPASLWARQP